VTVEDLASFERRAREFIEKTLPSLEWPSLAGDGRDRRSLFTPRAVEEAMVPVARQWRRAKFDAGFGWLTGPPEHGGAGLPDAYEARYNEIESGYDVPNEDCFATGVELGTVVLDRGNDALRGLLPAAYRGDLIACLLMSEPDAGSDLAALRTRAVADGGDWLVTGAKVWSSRTHYADIGLLLARTGTDQERHRGITAFVIDIRSPGVDVQPLRQMTGDAGFNQVFFDEVRVPDERRLGEVGEGWAISSATLAASRQALARSRRRGGPGGNAAVGSAERIRGVMDRLGRSGDPSLRQRLAALHTHYLLVKLTTERLAGAWSDPAAQAAARAMAKLGLADAMSEAAALVSHVLGPRLLADPGEPDSFEWLPYLLETPAFHIGGGTDEVLKNLIAERGLGLPR
jgi:alkylation response protein AidB-like acyl-CoA dehydrogenase